MKKEKIKGEKNLNDAYKTVLNVTEDMKTKWNHRKQNKVSVNTIIDKKELEANHFAKGLNVYKLLLICFIGSFVGVIVELFWCYINRGYIESRAGLVYGPFNLLYGVGAVLLTVCLYRYRNKSFWISFIGGFLVGSVLEYFCSLGQEMLIGSTSWNYSHMPLNINGRICLLYSLFWGFLGVVWIKKIYPLMAKLILKIPNKIGKVLTCIITIFFVFNIGVTSIALMRWTQRMDGISATNHFYEYIDERFSNERMEKIFANMKFVDKE